MSDAVSGLQAHQTWMDVVANNIANVSTPGFKSSGVDFTTVFAQMLAPGSAPNGARGGTNPQQVGMGVTIGGITQNLKEGALQQTGVPTNLALQGDGYFVLDNNGQGLAFTRVGDFSFDANGNLVSQSTGLKVEGWLATNGVLPTESAANLQDIVIPQNLTKPAVATTQVNYQGNLDAANAATNPPTAVVLPATVYDSLGDPWSITFTFTPTATPDQWNWTAALPTGSKATLGGTTNGTITFNPDGTYATTNPTVTMTLTAPGATSPQTITPNFTGLTQYNAATTAYAASQNGFPPGSLTGITVDSAGTITGRFSNGLTQTLGQVAVATFTNPDGLVQQASNVDVAGVNSGAPAIGVAGAGDAGTIVSGMLEGSNVNLARQFTNMIAAQSGFQANARVVTVTSQMLQSLVQI